MYHRNGAVYGFKRKIIIDEIAIKPAKTRYILCDTPQISIDTEFDLELAEFFMNKYQGLYTQRRKMLDKLINGKSILVTGGTGSFGKKFCETILKKYNQVV